MVSLSYKKTEEVCGKFGVNSPLVSKEKKVIECENVTLISGLVLEKGIISASEFFFPRQR